MDLNLRKEILKEHSKAQAEKICNYILNHPEAIEDLMNLFFYDDYRVSQRASWPVSLIGKKRPELLNPYLEKLILNLKNPVHDAVKRNSTKMLMFLEIPEELIGFTIDLMFRFLLDKKETVAVKANAMIVIFRLCNKEPDLIRELKFIIEDQLPYSSPGFISRANKILKPGFYKFNGE